MEKLFALENQGLEETIVCHMCGHSSTDDVFGADSFTNVLIAGGCFRVCKPCATLHKHGQKGLMAVITKETRDAAERSRRGLELAGFQQVKIKCARPKVVCSPSDETQYVG